MFPRAVLLLVFAAGLRAQQAVPGEIFRRAVAAQEQGDFPNAIALYRQLLASHPNDVELHVNLGAAYAAAGQFDDAAGQYRAALQQAPADPNIHFNLALALRGKHDYVAALDELKPLLAADRSDARVAALAADCDSRAGRYADAVSAALPAETAHPGDLDLAWVLGSAQIHSGQPAEGLRRIERVAAQNKDAEAYLLAGQTRLNLSEYDVALSHADAALALDPKLPGAHTLRGMALEHTGDLPGASAELERAIQQDSSDAIAHLYLGAILYFQRQLHPAREHLQIAIRLDPGASLARYELALVDRAEGNLTVAVKELEEVASRDPDWLQPHIELSSLYYRLHRTDEGARERQRVDLLELRRKGIDAKSSPLTVPAP